MSTDKSGVSDAVQVHLNDPGPGPDPDAKGPGDQWPVENRQTSRRKVDQFEEAPEGEVKGPHPDEWGDDARAERGAVS